MTTAHLLLAQQHHHASTLPTIDWLCGDNMDSSLTVLSTTSSSTSSSSTSTSTRNRMNRKRKQDQMIGREEACALASFGQNTTSTSSTSSSSASSGGFFVGMTETDDEAFVRGVFADAEDAGGFGSSPYSSSSISSPTTSYAQLLYSSTLEQGPVSDDLPSQQQQQQLSYSVPPTTSTPTISNTYSTASTSSEMTTTTTKTTTTTTTPDSSASLLMPWFKDVVQPPKDIDPQSIRCRRKNRRRTYQLPDGEATTTTSTKGKGRKSSKTTTTTTTTATPADATPGEQKGKCNKRSLGGSGGSGSGRGRRRESSPDEVARVDSYNYCGYFSLKKNASSSGQGSGNDDNATNDVEDKEKSKGKERDNKNDVVDKHIGPALRSLRRRIIDGGRSRNQRATSDRRAAALASGVASAEGNAASAETNNTAILNEYMYMLDLFRSHLAFFVPLCPAALQGANVQRVLFPQPGEEGVPGPLALNVYTALALASILVRDMTRAEHFFNLARTQLQFLFDTPDYSVAEALIGLRHYCVNAGHADKVTYYNTLAKNMCRQLNAYNSAAYTRCVLFDLLYPGTTPAEKKLVLQDYLTKSKSAPYYDYQPGLYSESESTLRRLLAFGQRITISIVITFATMSPHDATDSGSDGADRMTSKSVERLESEGKMLDVMLQKLAVWEKLISEQVHALNSKAAEGALLCVYGYRAECYWRLGRHAEALHWAKRFAELLHTTESGYTLHAVRQAMATVLNILCSTDQDEIVESLLRLIAPLKLYKYWCAVHEHFKTILDQKTIKKMHSEQQQEQEGPSSTTTTSGDCGSSLEMIEQDDKEISLHSDELKSIMQTILDSASDSTSDQSTSTTSSSSTETIEETAVGVAASMEIVVDDGLPVILPVDMSTTTDPSA